MYVQGCQIYCYFVNYVSLVLFSFFESSKSNIRLNKTTIYITTRIGRYDKTQLNVKIPEKSIISLSRYKYRVKMCQN